MTYFTNPRIGLETVGKRTGLSRSALLARGARMLIATELNS
jgi:hypothetical protein